MTLTNTPESMLAARLDRTLEYAVIQNWDDFMPASTPGVIRVEYSTGSDGSLDFLKLWASTVRGQWTRICELWVKPLWGHEAGLVMSDGFGSVAFAHTLNLVMGNEAAFVQLPDHMGSIQIGVPTDAERSQAKRWMDVAFSPQAEMPPAVAVDSPALSLAETR